MSRVGNKSIPVPAKVTIENKNGEVSVSGPKGKLSYVLPEGITLKQEESNLSVTRSSDERRQRSLHGTSQRLISNMIIGVNEGFLRQLEIHGTGFRAAVKGDKLDLSLGYSHPLLHPIPADLTVTVTENTKIKVEGIDKQRVGQFAADVRAYYPPEPYKGKGVRYTGEQIRRKEGKKVK
ncbi:MAG: 50S ribosomal protein L6 [Verrucomicrobiota bacterium]